MEKPATATRVRLAYRAHGSRRNSTLLAEFPLDGWAPRARRGILLLGNPTEWVWRRSERWGAVTCFPPSFLHVVFLPRARRIPQQWRAEIHPRSSATDHRHHLLLGDGDVVSCAS